MIAESSHACMTPNEQSDQSEKQPQRRSVASPTDAREPTNLTFIIPTRHPRNSKDWELLKTNLAQTVKSIAAQESPNWNAVIVANTESDLPALPDKFDVKRVDFPPNPLHEQGNADKEAYRDAFRIDKGRRVLAGMLHAGPTDYFMICDDDDFVSRELAGFTARHRGQNGWLIRDGYVWPNRGKLLYLHSDFSHYCGTSHIVRADLYALPPSVAQASDTYIKCMLGSHVSIEDELTRKGAPLSALPFPGAVYRIAHAGAHSKSAGLLRTFFLKRRNLRNPLLLLEVASRLRMVTPQLRHTFTLY